MLKIFRLPKRTPIEYSLPSIMDTWWGFQFWFIYVAEPCIGWPEKFTSCNSLIFSRFVWSEGTWVSCMTKTSALLKIWIIISAFDFVIPSTFSCTILRLFFEPVLSPVLPGRESWFVFKFRENFLFFFFLIFGYPDALSFADQALKSRDVWQPIWCRFVSCYHHI